MGAALPAALARNLIVPSPFANPIPAHSVVAPQAHANRCTTSRSLLEAILLRGEAMLRKLYDWVLSLSRHPKADRALAVISFAESSFFPIPPDVMLAPMIATRPERAYYYAAVCTAASVLGGILGYVIGYFLTDVGMALMRLLGHSEGLQQFRAWFDQWGLWVILIKGLTPVPYKLVTISSGMAAFSFPVFLAASIATRGGRFFLEAWILKRWGPAVLEMVEKRLAMWTAIGLVVLVGGFLALKLLH